MLGLHSDAVQLTFWKPFCPGHVAASRLVSMGISSSSWRKGPPISSKQHMSSNICHSFTLSLSFSLIYLLYTKSSTFFILLQVLRIYTNFFFTFVIFLPLWLIRWDISPWRCLFLFISHFMCSNVHLCLKIPNRKHNYNYAANSGIVSRLCRKLYSDWD